MPEENVHPPDSAASLRAEQRQADAEHAALVAKIIRALRRRESVEIPAAVHPDKIRRAARAAGNQLGRRISARRNSDGTVVIAIGDSPFPASRRTG
ncbi:hypothetical protein [Nocardiopsis trehalosi]|jgi:hypothetical protein|uniref:hypothetical protein n=1 Tax=Nocardiopsis trehalosi TaxID=109329 RepID=UPI000A93A755|nr:hypothetical protein [Nocardiopsis trehalosi]